MKLVNVVTQKMIQTQKLSMRQQFSLKVLEMNTHDLLDAVIEELEMNPVLEANEHIYSMQSTHKDTDFDLLLNYVEDRETLSDVLMKQLETCRKSVDISLGEFLIESLDDDGYLRMSNHEISSYTGKSEDDIEEMINRIQTFEPYGVAARSLDECLLIQLSFQESPYRRLAMNIVSEYLMQVADNRLPEIAQKIGCEMADVVQAVQLIKQMDPRPGINYASGSDYVEADVRVMVEDQEIKLELLSEQYDLRINHNYEQTKDKEVIQYLEQHMKSAKLLIESMKKRNVTLLAIVNCIVEHQRVFFLEHAQLSPLTLKNIADEIGIHESTISRAISNKYMEFEQRLIPLKFFFQAKLESGESANEIHIQLKRMIEEEDKHAPYSDQKLADLLSEHGVKISRRTVAKYREQLQIPPASRRKQF